MEVNDPNATAKSITWMSAFGARRLTKIYIVMGDNTPIISGYSANESLIPTPRIIVDSAVNIWKRGTLV
jgi:hypothetical protein